MKQIIQMSLVFAAWIGLIVIFAISWGCATKDIKRSQLDREMRESLVLTNGYVGNNIQAFNKLMINK